MRRICASLVLAAFWTMGHADDRAEAADMISDLRTLHAAGLSIDREAMQTSMPALGQCVSEKRARRDQAKSLRSRAMDLSDYGLRLALVRASDETFSCLYCAGNGAACLKVAPLLDEATAILDRSRPD